MPELPEVETMVRELREGSRDRGPSVLGRTLAGVTLRWPRHIAVPSAREFQRRLAGQKIEGLTRRGKYLVFHLTRDVMLIHLKMSGDLRVVNSDGRRPAPRSARTRRGRDRETPPAGKHAHTIFHFADGYSLQFRDTRKFGKVFLVARAEEVTGCLGPEPLARGFTAAKLGAMLAARRRALKPLLLDQTFIAGLGNIYTDEALHRAGLHPLRRSDSLRPDEVRALWRSIRRTLHLGIRHNGASIDWAYRGGGFQEHFNVYDRAGEPCFTCGTPIRRIVVGQRGTTFCPRCQRRR